LTGSSNGGLNVGGAINLASGTNANVTVSAQGSNGLGGNFLVDITGSSFSAFPSGGDIGGMCLGCNGGTRNQLVIHGNSGSDPQLYLFNAANTFRMGVMAPSTLATNWILTLPVAIPSANQAILTGNTDGSTSFGTAPTISSGFGTSPSIANSNGPQSFTVNVGTGGAASTGIVGLPTASHGWHCECVDITTNTSTVFACKQTGAGTTTTAPIGEFTAAGAAQAWTASDILAVSCFAY